MTRLDVLWGAELTRRAIASGKLPVPSPKPLELAGFALPNGAPIPPSLAALLAWDASWLESLGWFAGPRTLAEIAGADFDVPQFATCFALPGSCVFVVTSEPDALGEYPIAVTSAAEVPFL